MDAIISRGSYSVWYDTLCRILIQEPDSRDPLDSDDLLDRIYIVSEKLKIQLGQGDTHYNERAFVLFEYAGPRPYDITMFIFEEKSYDEAVVNDIVKICTNTRVLDAAGMPVSAKALKKISYDLTYFSCASVTGSLEELAEILDGKNFPVLRAYDIKDEWQNWEVDEAEVDEYIKILRKFRMSMEAKRTNHFNFCQRVCKSNEVPAINELPSKLLRILRVYPSQEDKSAISFENRPAHSIEVLWVKEVELAPESTFYRLKTLNVSNTDFIPYLESVKECDVLNVVALKGKFTADTMAKLSEYFGNWTFIRSVEFQGECPMGQIFVPEAKYLREMKIDLPNADIRITDLYNSFILYIDIKAASISTVKMKAKKDKYLEKLMSLKLDLLSAEKFDGSEIFCFLNTRENFTSATQLQFVDLKLPCESENFAGEILQHLSKHDNLKEVSLKFNTTPVERLDIQYDLLPQLQKNRLPEVNLKSFDAKCLHSTKLKEAQITLQYSWGSNTFGDAPVAKISGTGMDFDCNWSLQDGPEFVSQLLGKTTEEKLYQVIGAMLNSFGVAA